ncbi:hypothetical protein HY967_04100 [Candidatus Jorgensenbacteria bacterium]|nr:hypothetical protein [Candidatus Jorgensenbacteria bacterium]
MPKKKDFEFQGLMSLFAAIAILGIIFYLVGEQIGFPGRERTPQDERMWRKGEEQKVAALIKSGSFESCESVNYASSDGIDYKIVCKNNIAVNKAIETLDMLWCGKLDNNLFSIDDCERRVIGQKLAEAPSLSVCNEAPRAAIKSDCETAYWLDKAIRDNNVGACANVEQANQASCEEIYWAERLARDSKSIDCSTVVTSLKVDCEALKLARRNPSQAFQYCSRIGNSRLAIACGR